MSEKKPRQPREKLSLPLSPEITKAVQLIAKQYGHPQAQVLSDLAAKLQVRGIPFALAELSQKYDKQRREELAVALGTSIINPPAPGVLDDVVPGDPVAQHLAAERQETSVRPLLSGPGLIGKGQVPGWPAGAEPAVVGKAVMEADVYRRDEQCAWTGADTPADEELVQG